MSKVLEQRRNSLGQGKQVKEKQTISKQKSNDFIFKRYRYEENTIINSGKGNDKVSKYNNEHEYEQMNKENDLEKYKRDLEKENNHFDIVDFGDGADQEHHQRPSANNNAKENTNFDNPFEFDEEQQTDRNQNQRSQKIDNQPEKIENIPAKYNQEFEIKPMELIDFMDQDEDQIVDVTPATKKFFSTSKQENFHSQQNPNIYPLISSSSYKTVMSFNKSQISSTFMISPDQSLDGSTCLQESVCTFVKKGKKSQTNSNHQPQKCFSPLNIDMEKYQIHKMSENDNPFEGAMDYSNEEQLKGIKIYQSPFQDIKVQIFDKDLFVSSKIPPGIILKCKLKRSKGFFSMMSPQFDLYLENGLKHLISARKNLFRNRQLFQLSTQMSNFQRPIRTLMANVLHNTYWLVDAPRLIDKKKISYLDLLIDYQPIDEEGKKQREMTILCPPSLKTYHIGLEYDIPYIDFQWFKKSIALKLYFKGVKSSKIKNSEKNFELVDSEDEQDEDDEVKEENYVRDSIESQKEQTGQSLVNQANKEEQKNDNYLYLKMQKESQNVFDIEIQHPLTPLQAMAIILTRFDAQLK